MSLGGAVGSAVGRVGRRVLYGTAVLGPLAGRLRPRACVLMYHRVASPRSDPFGQAVEPERFMEQLDALRDRFHVWSLDELIEGLHGGDYPDETIAVTFDDGYADTLETAYPIAAALEIPLHVFVTAGPVSAADGVFWWDELAALDAVTGGYGALHDELRRLPGAARAARLATLRDRRSPAEIVDAGHPMTPDELAQLARLPFASVGAHTLTHPALAALPAEEQLYEMREARRQLENLTGAVVDVLAYPFGKDADVSDETMRLAKEAGYRAALMSTPRALVPSSNPFGMPRLAVHDWTAAELVQRIREVLGPLRSFVPRPRRHGGVVYHRGRGPRALALTFDDGPSQWTPALLDILRDHGARATFFVLGSAVDGHEETLRRVLAEGHEIGNHLFEHRDPDLLGDDELLDQLQRASRAIADATDATPRLVRPPYGHDARRVSRIAASAGLGRTILGSIDPSDWRAESAGAIVRHVLAAARPGAIVFLHDGVPPPDGTAATRDRTPTVEAVAELVPKLTSRGYTLVTVSELLG